MMQTGLGLWNDFVVYLREKLPNNPRNTQQQMELISIYFALLAILSAVIYYALHQKYRILFLNLLSLGFIASLNMYLLLYILAFTIFNYFIGLKIPELRNKKALFRVGLIFNLLQLILLKYADFTIDPILRLFDSDLALTRLSEIIVPIGISYFTLQGIGYLVNVKMGWEKPERKFMDFLLYITFFPKFLSGPIARSNRLLPQFKEEGKFEQDKFTSGLKTAFWGFFKKLVIANQLAPYVGQAYENADIIGGEYVWLTILIQPLYLYFDFSGYTDIAIGFGRMFGIELPPNFNRPFTSQNITNFWKRFHISLSSWFNDYVFMRLIFRYRKLKNWASIIAIFLTWSLFGIWHGAGWNFMILGFVLAISIIYEYFTKRTRARLFAKLPTVPRIWLGRLCTYVFYGLALSFFFSPDLPSTIHFFSNIFNFTGVTPGHILVMPLLFGLALALLYQVFEFVQTDFEEFYTKLEGYWNKYKVIQVLVYYVIAILVISEMGGNSSFVYEMF
jgi:alginate O-acetyltransferase complex protein AlgI